MKNLAINYKTEIGGKDFQISVEKGKVSAHFYEVNATENSRINVTSEKGAITKNVNTTGDYLKFAELVVAAENYLKGVAEKLTIVYDAIESDESVN